MAVASIRGNPANPGSAYRMRYAGVPPNELYNCSRRLWPGRGRARGFAHSQFGEDLFLFWRHFTRPVPLRAGFFIEVGGFNGWDYSNSLFYEVCLGWRGLLLEGSPHSFARLRENRPNAITLGRAVCR